MRYRISNTDSNVTSSSVSLRGFSPTGRSSSTWETHSSSDPPRRPRRPPRQVGFPGNPLAAVLVAVFCDGLRHPGVTDLPMAAFCVLSTHFERPDIPFVGPTQVFVCWMRHFGGTETGTILQLNRYFPFPISVTRGSLTSHPWHSLDAREAEKQLRSDVAGSKREV